MSADPVLRKIGVEIDEKIVSEKLFGASKRDVDALVLSIYERYDDVDE